MVFNSTLPAGQLKILIRSMISGVTEMGDNQAYSLGFIVQKAEPKINITKSEAIAELNVLLNAVSQFPEGESVKYQIQMPIFSEIEENTLQLINSKYKAALSLQPQQANIPTLVK